MDIEIYSDEEVEKEERLILRLIDNGYGSVDLVAVDEDGEVLDCGYILSINEEGTLTRHFGCDVPGIELDAEGAIKEAL